MATPLTQEVLDHFGIKYSQLQSLMRSQKFETPTKDASGRYIWTHDDIRRLAKSLHRAVPMLGGIKRG